jgi:uncharacterized peroxidase-related enzyme
MRLQKVEQGDGIFRALLIGFISKVSGMRLPDAARIVMYHRDFYGKPMTAWTQAAMRGKSGWSVGERELFAAMTAKWNSCPFCVEAHGAIASLALSKTTVHAALEDFHNAKLPTKLLAMLEFLEAFVEAPDTISEEQVVILLQHGTSKEELEDAIAVAVLFSITVRCANALNFKLLNDVDQSKAAKRMLTQGYVFGKGKPEGRADHLAFAQELRRRILEEPAITASDLRQAMARRASGGSSVSEPAFDSVASQIGKNSYKVTDDDIIKLVDKAGSEKAAFELITASAVGIGLYLWQRGTDLLALIKDKTIQ